MPGQNIAVAEKASLMSSIARWPQAVQEYVSDIRAEMKRVTWPTQKQVRATTGVVIIAVFLFAGFFAAVDLLLGNAVNSLFNTLAKR